MVRVQDGRMEKDGTMGMVFDGVGVGWRDGERRGSKAENSMADGRRADGARNGVCANGGWSAKKRAAESVNSRPRGYSTWFNRLGSYYK